MVFEKLFKFIGKNIKALVDRPDQPYCFRLQKNRVYYVREDLMKKATNVSDRKQAAQACLASLESVERTPPRRTASARCQLAHSDLQCSKNLQQRAHVLTMCPRGCACADSKR